MRISNKLSVDTLRCSRIILKAAAILLVFCPVVFPAALYGEDGAGARSAVREVSQQPVTVTGTVTDESGEPLAGVTITLKTSVKMDRAIANLTDANGKYIFTGLKAGDHLIFTFIGMEPFEVVIKQGQTLYNVTMHYSESQLKEVVVETGIFQRDAVSYTGSVSQYTGSNLKVIGNQNVIQSLKVLDPSFVVIDNNSMGSNPNTTATIELRGQGSATINAITDEFSEAPNQPLFVINGVESSYSRVADLDINRVESITILKDASSTAIYGSKGANGVVVIETIKPKSGELRLYYNGDYGISWPDLSVYNLMNSTEKLEFERLSGKYSSSSGNIQKLLTELYNERAAEIARGVDTYWIKEPVHTALTHAHSLRVNGGDQLFSFSVGAKYKCNDGVMKKSGRETWGGDIALTYRTDKIIVNNTLDVSGYTGKESPYGDFDDWAKASPYFRKYNSEGGVDKFLQYKNDGLLSGNNSPVKTNVPNPMHNARLNSKDEKTGLDLQNSLSIQYLVNKDLRLKGGVDLSIGRINLVQFTAPEHTKYNDLSEYYQGEYYGKDTRSSSFRGYADVSYAKVVDKVHSFALMTRGQIKQNKNDYTSFQAVGFPYGSKGSPSMAHGYKEESNPGYYLAKKRSVALTGAFNYNYDKRYLLDLTYSLDGATSFGSNKLYKSFWSAGLGWNIDREAFMKDIEWIDQLKLRASTGLTGNQNQGRAVSETVYKLYISSNYFGQGLYIDEFANPDLPWQTARDYGTGLDFNAGKGRYFLKFDYFHSKTDPNIVFVPQVPSTGISSYPMALGALTKQGVEMKLMVYPIYNLKERIMWGITLTGLKSKSKYSGIGKTLDIFNESQRKNNTLAQYRDGFSPTDIWAVRSYGIDPATGEEVFIKKNGELTKEYSFDDVVKVGNTRPDLTGVISTNLRYKNFHINVALRYSYGGDVYNYALFNKVENISLEALQYNQDKRALTLRWKNAGDNAMFKAITITETTANKTSRFVQKNNYLNGESISFSYEVNNNEWMAKNLGVKTLRLTGYMNDFFRLETSKTERGVNYPFARSFSVGLNLSF